MYRIMGIIDKAFNLTRFDEIFVIRQFLSLSLIIISSIDNRVTNQVVKLKVQFFTILSNLNAINNTVLKCLFHLLKLCFESLSMCVRIVCIYESPLFMF